MNRKQRIVVGAGLFLVVLNGVFLPFQGEVKGLKDSPMVTVPMGYHFISRPPARLEVFKTMRHENLFQSLNSDQIKEHAQLVDYALKTGKTAKEADETAAEILLDYDSLSISSHVEVSLFFLQFVTIVASIIGAFFLFGQGDIANGKKQV